MKKRTNQLKTVVVEYDKHIKNLRKEGVIDAYPRICQINSPTSGGDVEFVLQHDDWTSKKAITYRADGRWSQPSYWEVGQI